MPTLNDLEPLLTAPIEALDVEYKGWLDLRGNDEHKGLIAKAAIALANEGGGYIVIGIREERPALVSEPRPAEIAAYDQDLINQIIRRFANPAFQCRLTVLPHPETGHEVAVVTVPGGFTSPVMSKRGTQNQTIRPHLCYMRKPGPESAPPENQGDWDRLLAKCLRNRREEMLDAIRTIVEGGAATARTVAGRINEQQSFVRDSRERWQKLIRDLPADAPARCPFGRYEIDYVVLGDFPRPSLGELLDMIRRAKVPHTGWPEFWVPTRPEMEPIPIDDGIECWIGTPKMGPRDSGHVDFWRASSDGRMFLLRGYGEDAGGWPGRPIEPGTVIDVGLPIFRVGEGLLHAANLAEMLAGPDATVMLRSRWYSLAGRRLGHLDEWRDFFMPGEYISQQDSYETKTTVPIRQISDNLPEIVHSTLFPLYERFSFYRLEVTLVASELARMRANRFS